MKVLVPLAEGFEEIEAITVIDILRRAEIEVVTLFLRSETVKGAHGISVKADADAAEVKSSDFDAIVLPGGMPGSRNLLEDAEISRLLKEMHEKDGYIAAICAAPMVLGNAGLLRGKKATCFPGYESHMSGAEYIQKPFVEDGRIITGRGPGAAIAFSLKLVEIFRSPEKAAEIRSAMQVYWQDEK